MNTTTHVALRQANPDRQEVRRVFWMYDELGLATGELTYDQDRADQLVAEGWATGYFTEWENWTK